jgi:hypothetical protein
MYTPTKAYSIPTTEVTARIISMAISPSEDLLAVCLSSCQILQISMAQADAKDDTVFASVPDFTHVAFASASASSYSPRWL